MTERNFGTVSVSGDGSTGIRALAAGNARSATAENRGRVLVTPGSDAPNLGPIGRVPAGLTAFIGGADGMGSVTFINNGTVTVNPENGYGLHGRHDGSGTAAVRNEAGGVVDADIALKFGGGSQASGNSVMNAGTLRGRFESAAGSSAAGGGTDAFRNVGTLHLGRSASEQADIVEIAGLETFTQTPEGVLSMDLFLDAGGNGPCSESLDLGTAKVEIDGALAIGSVALSSYAPRDRICDLIAVDSITVDSAAPPIQVGASFLKGSRETVAVQLGPGVCAHGAGAGAGGAHALPVPARRAPFG